VRDWTTLLRRDGKLLDTETYGVSVAGKPKAVTPLKRHFDVMEIVTLSPLKQGRSRFRAKPTKQMQAADAKKLGYIGLDGEKIIFVMRADGAMWLILAVRASQLYLIKKREYIKDAKALGHEDEEHCRVDEDGGLPLLPCTATRSLGREM
jgi:hypothetical protein